VEQQGVTLDIQPTCDHFAACSNGAVVRRTAMDEHQRDVLRMAFYEAYLCLRERNRPQVTVDGRQMYADAELATAIRLFAQRFLTVEAERDRLVRELQPLWEARMSGVLDRLLEAIEHVHELESGGWHVVCAKPALTLHDSDLQMLRTLLREPDEQPLNR
jgi:hypothetical protein